VAKLEYYVQAWNLYIKKDIVILEKYRRDYSKVMLSDITL